MGAAESHDSERMDADAFLRMLGERHTFQTFGEGPAKGNASLRRIMHGTLAEHAPTLARVNANGAGVFVTVNATDGKGRKAANVTTVRALFADLDGAPLEPVTAFPLPPHCVTQTSPGRWHAYWLADTVPLDEFEGLQRAIAMRFGSDPKVYDLPRVMRLPGFTHMKAAPFTSRIEILRHGPRYTHAELAQVFVPAPAPTSRAGKREVSTMIVEGERNSRLFESASGFVRSGLSPIAVNERIQKINADRCRPPLCASEVDTIATNASASGSRGFLTIQHDLVDSPQWKMLAPASRVVALAFYRQFNGHNNGRLALPWSAFEPQRGIKNSGGYYKHLRRVVNAGFLIKVCEDHNVQSGHAPAMYAIPDQYLAQVSKRDTAPSPKTEHLGR